MKRYITVLLSAAIACCAFAQSKMPSAAATTLQRRPHTTATATPKPPMRISLAENQVVMGAYSSDEYIASTDYSQGLPRYPGTLKMAQVIPADVLKAFHGCRIVKMRVAFTVAPGSSQFFIAPLNAKGEVQRNAFQQTVSSAKAGWNLVTLSTPYEIDATDLGGLLIGFSYQQVNTNDGYYYDDKCFPLSIVATGENYPIWVSGIGGDSSWLDYGTGNLSVQAVVEGDFPNVAAQPLNYGSVLIPLGKTVEQTVRVRNMGKKAIRNVTYTLTANGKTGAERTVTLSNALATFCGTAEIEVPLAASTTEGTERRIITITKVNGVPNGADIQSAYGLVASSATTIERRSVVEEYTGTACGWCPRGIVGMEKLRQKFADRFIGIAIHQYNASDAMYIAPESYAATGLSGAPSCLVDRSGEVDPYYGSEAAVQFQLSQPAKVAIEVDAEWASTGNNVNIKATATSPIEGASFNIEYVLVADGLSGNTTSWAQANYYSSQFASSTGLSKNQLEDDLLFLWDKGDSFYTTFNDVAVASSYVDGVNQATPLTDLRPAESQTGSFMLTVPRKLATAVKKGTLYAVALVIDDDGTITNAAKCEVRPYGTGIHAIGTAAQGATQVFSIDGRTLPAPQRGINIVRQPDGSVRKVLIP